MAKRKGNEVLIEAEKPMKRKSQIQLDEELAKKLYEEELAQVEAEKAAATLKKQRAQMKRKPSTKEITKDERIKKITFLKSALNVNVKMLTKMNYKNLEDLYKKEMKTLQGDSERREEIDRKLNASHDI